MPMIFYRVHIKAKNPSPATAPSTAVNAEETLVAAPVKLTIPPLPLDPPLLEPVEEATPPEPVPVAVAPAVEVEFKGMKVPPEMLGGEVLVLVLAAASL